MMSDDVRAAVERLRRLYPFGNEKYKAVYGRSGAGAEMDHERDMGDVVIAYLREHPVDDGEAIDEAWLRSVGAKKDDHPHKWTFEREDAMPIGLWSVGDGWKAMLLHNDHAASCITRGLKTRGDLRRLASALAIPLKPEEPT